MDFKFSYHFNDYRNIKRTVYFQLSGTEYAIQIIQNLEILMTHIDRQKHDCKLKG